MAIGKLALRAVVGGLVAGHGLQKLNGSFDGPGPEGTEQAMAAIGLHPAKVQARMAALTETVGGFLTAAGLFSPLGPAMITGAMTVAVRKVHLEKGPWVANGGYEYNLLIGAACFAVAAEGPGPLSLDAVGTERKGLFWGLVELGLGVGAAELVLRVSEQFAPAVADGESSSTDGPAPAGPGSESRGAHQAA